MGILVAHWSHICYAQTWYVGLEKPEEYTTRGTKKQPRAFA